MIIGNFALGDMVTTLVRQDPMRPDEPPMYHLINMDLFSGKSYTKVILGENNAVRAFCAAISSDEPDLTKDLEALLADPGMDGFLA